MELSQHNSVQYTKQQHAAVVVY